LGTRTSRATKKKISVLVADREGVFRLGLMKLLGVEDDLRVVSQAENAAQLVAMTSCFKPEVVFLQSEILSEGPADLISQVHHASPRCKVVVTVTTQGEAEGLDYVRGGAAGVILRSADPELFPKCVRKVTEGELWVPKRQVTQMAKDLEASSQGSARPVETLTRREKTVIGCLMLGWRNREIATQLSITEQTVKNHLRAIYDKVGVSDRLELVLYVIHQRLEIPPVQPLEATP